MTARTRQGFVLAAALLGGLALGALVLYAWVGQPTALDAVDSTMTGPPQPSTLGTPGPAAPVTAPSMTEVTARLAARLAADGGTPADWRLLAQSYEFLGQADLAAAARQRAGDPAKGSQADVTAGSGVTSERPP